MTTWLTRLVPNPQSHQAQRDLTGPGTGIGLHHRVMKLFPDNLGPDPRAKLGVLFRLEDTPRGPHLLIQSQHEPTLDRLPEHYATLTTRPLDALLDALQPGRTLHYRCVASPVRKPGAETRRLYQLPPVVALSGTAADEWWLRQTQTAGLTPTTHHSTPLDTIRGQQPDKHGHRDHNRIRHARTRFDGTATITDPARLRHTILNGIGRAKAYGCGLLSITPAQDTA
ncbi:MULTISPECIES: type I-E CRISPR-associated protein Cas6/Cse3/CasE [Streptomyces]|uniref:type I-E CRISPR-associated protein Cas6/Cse3/CasE n=2 Tax=Streptomyces TaxID=1883 RepID=UPI0004CC7C13|nr:MULTISPECIES: type I-E CRISPR-associated protein Cas6/Cse3/CasE [Streptomyces]UDF11845.1 type I-E CRISPR-associated protein Cas6/Cse3/CasE [Streptomyces sp. WA1-19]UDF11887.1 type I-E CRISPR-associated protein Cas6/Cse3/CasE [Streptomyces sp. WA1-19]UKL04161.1 type I-E CRISPR-associated protein Cas6/Cse3/CasE [Streptomyces sp. NBU3104]